MRAHSSAARTRRNTVGRAVVVLAAVLLGAPLIAGCGPGTSPTPTRSAAPDSPEKVTATPPPSVTPTPVPAPTPAQVPVPTTCQEAYTPELFAQLEATHPPLNDVSMTDVTFSEIERLDNTIRAGHPLVCTWGVAGPVGIVTAVSRISEQQSAAAHSAMQEGGFTCTAAGEAVTCVFQKEGEQGFVVGESHYLRGTIGVSTRWINASIEGYTEGMVAAIWK